MRFAAKSAFFLVASTFVAVSPALAEPAQTPAPLAGAGLLALGAMAYVGRKLRRTR